MDGIEESGDECVDVRPGREVWLRCCVKGDEAGSSGSGLSLDC